MKCKKCHLETVRNGKTGNGTQRYYCRSCRVSQQAGYLYHAYNPEKNLQLIRLIKEGCGIRSSGRLLDISPTTVIKRILYLAKDLSTSRPIVRYQSYEVDELFTYIKKKENRVCIAYSLNPVTKEVINIVVGRRNKTNLLKIISTLLLADARQITTDKLNIYKELIPKELHCTKHRGINRIERTNLDLRTHIKRLNRRTICFSKSLFVLTAIVKIYFWA